LTSLNKNGFIVFLFKGFLILVTKKIITIFYALSLLSQSQIALSSEQLIDIYNNPTKEQNIVYDEQKNQQEWIRVNIEEKDKDEVLKKLEIPEEYIGGIEEIFTEVRFEELKNKKSTITADYNYGDLEKIYIETNNKTLILEQNREGIFVLTECQNPFQYKIVKQKIRAYQSVEHGFQENGISVNLTQQYNKIFEKILSKTKNPKLYFDAEIIYKKVYLNKHPIGEGNIIAAKYSDTENSRYAYLWDKEKEEYYDQNEYSVHENLLIKPIDSNIITGKFHETRKVSYKTKKQKNKITYKTIIDKKTKRKNKIKISTPTYLTIVKSHVHKGVDYPASIGTKVRAAGDGVVQFTGNAGAYGNLIEIKHYDGMVSYYGHLSKFFNNIMAGDEVKQGDLIGYVGNTGRSTGPHLHYEIRNQDGNEINPLMVNTGKGKTIPEYDKIQFKKLVKEMNTKFDENIF